MKLSPNAIKLLDVATKGQFRVGIASIRKCSREIAMVARVNKAFLDDRHCDAGKRQDQREDGGRGRHRETCSACGCLGDRTPGSHRWDT